MVGRHRSLSVRRFGRSFPVFMPDTPELLRLLVCSDSILSCVDFPCVPDESGEEVCLTGPNGAGKSTLLARLHDAFRGIDPGAASNSGNLSKEYLVAKFRDGDGGFFIARAGGADPLRFRAEMESSPHWLRLLGDPPQFDGLQELFADDVEEAAAPSFPPTMWFGSGGGLLDGSAAEGFEELLTDLDRSRRAALHRFLLAPENRARSVAELMEQFETQSPAALAGLRRVWCEALAAVGARCDFDAPDGPFVGASGEPVDASRFGRPLLRLLHGTALAAVAGARWGRFLLFLDEPAEGLDPRLAASAVALFREAAGPGAVLYAATTDPVAAAAFPESRRFPMARGAGGEIVFSSGRRDGPTADEPTPTGPAAAESAPSSAAVAAEPAAKEGRARVPGMESELADMIDEVISFRQS